VVAFQRPTLLPLDDCLYTLQATIPHLTRSSLHRCLQRHGISRLPEVEGDKPVKRKYKPYPIDSFYINIAQGQNRGRQALVVASTDCAWRHWTLRASGGQRLSKCHERHQT
jgi:hypothetical protein